jgi:hypothetical protein
VIGPLSGPIFGQYSLVFHLECHFAVRSEAVCTKSEVACRPSGKVGLIFFQDAEMLVIVCGFIKKTRTTPKDELTNARKRQGEYKKNKEKPK